MTSDRHASFLIRKKDWNGNGNGSRNGKVGFESRAAVLLGCR